MKGKFSKEIKIGILVIVTIGLFIWGYGFLHGKRIFSPSDTYYVVYDRVGGLVQSADVMVRGYKIGHVEELRFEEIDRFVVRLTITNRFDLPAGTVARIVSADVLGTRAIEIVPGPFDVKHSPGDTLIGDIEPDLLADIGNYLIPLADKAGDMMASMDTLLIVFKTMLDQEFREQFAETVDNISVATASLQRSLHSADTLITREESRFNRIIGNLESISGNIEGSNQDINTILSNFAALSDSLAQAELLSAVNNLNSVISETNQIMEKIERGEGSLGKLVNDEDLYRNLDSATRNLDSLLIDLRERPGRYVNFSIFGRRGN